MKVIEPVATRWKKLTLDALGRLVKVTEPQHPFARLAECPSWAGNCAAEHSPVNTFGVTLGECGEVRGGGRSFGAVFGDGGFAVDGAFGGDAEWGVESGELVSVGRAVEADWGERAEWGFGLIWLRFDGAAGFDDFGAWGGDDI